MRSMCEFCNAIVRAGRPIFGVFLVALCVFVCTGVALTMDMVFSMPFWSIVMTKVFTYMIVNGPVMRDSSLLYLVDAFLSSAIKVG